MRLRIVAGTLGGRLISAPSRPTLRATSERVREAWFSALGVRVEDAVVLDLFAGSGALGIEALSRGAAHVDFVESDSRLIRAIRSNLGTLGLEDRARVSRSEAFAFLQRSLRRRWDVVLADPPYRKGLAERLADAYRARPFARILCVEHEPAVSLARPGDWSRAYGDTQLTFLVAGETGSETETDQ